MAGSSPMPAPRTAAGSMPRPRSRARRPRCRRGRGSGSAMCCSRSNAARSCSTFWEVTMAVGEWDQRQLCPDGACIGVIGPDGTCKVCGRAAPNWGDERNRGLIDPEDEDPDEANLATARADDEEDDEDDDDDDDDDEDDDEEDEDEDEDEDDEYAGRSRPIHPIPKKRDILAEVAELIAEEELAVAEEVHRTNPPTALDKKEEPAPQEQPPTPRQEKKLT